MLETTGVQISHPICFPSQTTLANVCFVCQTTLTEDTELPFFILQKIAIIILFESQCGDHNASTAEPYLVNVIFPLVMRSTDNGDGMLSLLKQSTAGLVSDVRALASTHSPLFPLPLLFHTWPSSTNFTLKHWQFVPVCFFV